MGTSVFLSSNHDIEYIIAKTPTGCFPLYSTFTSPLMNSQLKSEMKSTIAIFVVDVYEEKKNNMLRIQCPRKLPMMWLIVTRCYDIILC